MAKNRKPVPKTQREISEGFVEPYDPRMGDPNEADRYPINPLINQAGINFNRSEKLSHKGDTHKQFTIGLEDIDEGIFYYFNNIIQPSVIQNNERINVPIIYNLAERWKTYQRDGIYRDRSGKIMSPIIAIKRNSITRNRGIATKLDANQPHIYTSWQKPYNKKNIYSNFNVLNNRVQTKQFVANVMPEYVNITYDVIIQTYYIDQLNKIIEAINYASDAYWGNPERFKFKAIIDSFSDTSQILQNDERIAKSTFTLNMYGYIIPDVLQKDLNAIKKFNSKSKIIFQMETTYNEEVFDPTPEETEDGRSRLNNTINLPKRINPNE